MTIANAGIAWGRNYSLVFRPLDNREGANEDITIAQEHLSGTSGVVSTGIAIQFSVVKSMPAFNTGNAQRANIRVYNLSPETMRRILEPGWFSFSVGHDNQSVEIFSGILSGSTSGREGANTYTDFALIDKDIVSAHRYFEKSYAKNTKLGTIIGDIVTFIMENYYPKSRVDAFTLDDKTVNKTYKSPVTIRGDSINLLAKLLPDHYVYMVARQVRVIPRSFDGVNYFSNRSVIFNPDFGQVGYIRPTGRPASETYKNTYIGVEAQSILQPDIDLNTIIQVVPSELQRRIRDASTKTKATKGLSSKEQTYVNKRNASNDPTDDFNYRVTSVTHEGNTFRGEFLTTWKGELINTVSSGKGLE